MAQHTERTAYVAGYRASARSVSVDMGAAEARYERTHGTAHADAWARGWTDAAIGRTADPDRTDAQRAAESDPACLCVIPERMAETPDDAPRCAYCDRPILWGYTDRNASRIANALDAAPDASDGWSARW